MNCSEPKLAYINRKLENDFLRRKIKGKKKKTKNISSYFFENEITTHTRTVKYLIVNLNVQTEFKNLL
jgi:hypothetical protein